MLSVRTTLVLGAGTSMPYGFPSGEQLRTKLQSPENLGPLQKKFSFDFEDIEAFCAEFRHSQLESIDAFLARRGEQTLPNSRVTFGEIGKAAIALVLIQCEQKEQLFDSKSDDHWYQYLWRFVANSLEEMSSKDLTIITFNYDRSLEYYLLKTMQAVTGESEAEAVSRLKNIEIIHVYGQLGALPGLEREGELAREFSPSIEGTRISVAANGIKVIAESRDDEPTFAAAKAALVRADRVCFLGFGFDSLNVQRLGIKECLTGSFAQKNFRGPLVYSTSLGMMDAERNAIIDLFTPDPAKLDITDGAWMHYFDKFREQVRRDISNYSEQKSMNYLRHTGVLKQG